MTEGGQAVCGTAFKTWWDGDVAKMTPPDPSPARYVAVSVGEGRDWDLWDPWDRGGEIVYACALTDSGRAVCWSNEPNTIERPERSSGRYVALSDGYGHTCALTEAGEAVCWGWNNFGQADPPAGRYSAISAGVLATCAIADSGEVVCWGGPWGIEPSPGEYVAISTGGFSAGGSEACALTAAGDAVCWNSQGRTEGPLAEAPPGPLASIVLDWFGQACALSHPLDGGECPAGATRPCPRQADTGPA